MKEEVKAQQLLALLPQTQCKRCGFEDCQAYANAIVLEGIPINQCPPGGQEGVERIAHFLGFSSTALNPEFGLESPRRVAFIDENWCIGCTLCLEACPTDAIFGTHKSMHTIIEAECTGCELCVPVCPVDCIELEWATFEHETGWKAWSSEQAQRAQSRYALHTLRLQNPASSAPKNHVEAKRQNTTIGAEQGEKDQSRESLAQDLLKAALLKARE
jgi:electron transport complex protein RnfB